MSAKSTQGPGGKKPASAATNLIGTLGHSNWKNCIDQWQFADFYLQLVVVLV
jgi:hypothetical protein